MPCLSGRPKKLNDCRKINSLHFSHTFWFSCTYVLNKEQLKNQLCMSPSHRSSQKKAILLVVGFARLMILGILTGSEPRTNGKENPFCVVYATHFKLSQSDSHQSRLFAVYHECSKREYSQKNLCFSQSPKLDIPTQPR